MASEWDIAIYDRSEQLVLIAEVKTNQAADVEWARRIRRYLFEYEFYPSVRYFLIALPDQFYLWVRHLSGSMPDAAPDYIIDAHPIVQPYLERTGLRADRLSSTSLEIIVADWFGEVMFKEVEELTSSEQWLIESGLHGAIVGGRFAYRILA
jgi:hypothetical protein